MSNLRTKPHVVVTINGRGPYGGGKGRIIDLSEAVATRVGLREHGPDRVHVVVVEHASSDVIPQRRDLSIHARVCHDASREAYRRMGSDAEAYLV
jgi:rare lipoprotein A